MLESTPTFTLNMWYYTDYRYILDCISLVQGSISHFYESSEEIKIGDHRQVLYIPTKHNNQYTGNIHTSNSPTQILQILKKVNA